MPAHLCLTMIGWRCSQGKLGFLAGTEIGAAEASIETDLQYLGEAFKNGKGYQAAGLCIVSKL